MKNISLLETWKLFAEVAETGSFRPVAKRYGLSPSTLTRRINFLEKQNGMTLLTRGPRGVELTEVGNSLYLEVKQDLASLQTFHKSSQRPDFFRLLVCIDCRLPLSPFVSFAHEWQRGNLGASLEFLSSDFELKTLSSMKENYHGIVRICRGAKADTQLHRVFVANPHMILRNKQFLPLSSMGEIGLISVRESYVRFSSADGETHEKLASLVVPNYESALLSCTRGSGLFLAYEDREIDRLIADNSLSKVLSGWSGETLSFKISSIGDTAGLRDCLQRCLNTLAKTGKVYINP